MPKLFNFAIDRGGTFTDIYAEVPSQDEPVVMKLLSVDPQNYDDAPREGIRRIMQHALKKELPTAKDIDTSQIGWIRMGTTVATNALLERKGEPCLLITTRGFKDLLKIGNQSRPKIFDLMIEKPSLLYSKVVELEERVRLVNEKEQFDKNDSRYVECLSGQYVEVMQEPDYVQLEQQLKQVFEQEKIRSVAVVFIHSYIFNRHEIAVGNICKKIGFDNVSLSHEVMPMIRAVPRGLTTCVDAYLTPIIRRYVDNFCAGFKDNLKGVNVTFMQSDGGLTPANNFLGCKAIMSGPAGGYVGFSATAYDQKTKVPVIGFDMGGTSTDVSRFGGEFDHVFETELAGVTVQAPQLDITTVAAGGGSMLFFRAGMFVAGPESAGAHPGPVCYRKGGPLTITDANLFLGRIVPDYFPKIFGSTEDQPLDYEGTKEAFGKLTEQINEHLKSQNQSPMTPDEVAWGFIKVANETMCRPIRNITVAKGYDTRDHILSCFGGAGAQHACSIAEALGMKKVLIHKYSGILSAYGLGLADVVVEEQEPCTLVYKDDNMNYVNERFQNLGEKAILRLKNEGFSESNIKVNRFLNLRYHGTDFAIMTNLAEDDSSGDYFAEFERRYKREYGFTIKGRNVIVDDIRIRAIGITPSIKEHKMPKSTKQPEPINHCDTFFEGGRFRTPIYNLDKLGAGDKFDGPCIIIQAITTIVVNPGCIAEITENGNVEIEILASEKHSKRTVGIEMDPVQLSIFANRFMSIAEQMGRALQRTAISTNIKERLDFSCAIFSPTGGLVANAPHVPVHLGSMSEAVKFQIESLGNEWKEGEVIMANHPKAGGTHLPDITVITPVYKEGKPVFYVANRGHHADIGGITPGSMPPNSRYLDEEGVNVKSFKLVANERFQLETVTDLFKESRNLKDNIADLQAQVASNTKGIGLISDLIDEYSLPVVHAYMQHVQTAAEMAVREVLAKVSQQHGSVLIAEDFMDDGTNICLKITIQPEERSAVFDFTGTSENVLGNTNAPKAIAISAILYCLRCLVKQSIPLNEGCLKPIKIILPKDSILDPSDELGVVGGNVLTSQRITDVVLKAFHVCAASQGCMNNFTFGNASMGYYETICGGAGAGPNWEGQDAVHTHMTNTRITDVEILEKRYPVLLRQFSVRSGSGGEGEYRGGHGVIREFEFLEPLQVGILSERRVFAPFGMNGGKNGERGKNLLYRNHKHGATVCNLGPKNAFSVQPGDRVIIMTPGGGGWGAKK